MGGEAVCPDSGQDHGQRSARIFKQIPWGNAALHLGPRAHSVRNVQCGFGESLGRAAPEHSAQRVLTVRHTVAGCIRGGRA